MRSSRRGVLQKSGAGGGGARCQRGAAFFFKTLLFSRQKVFWRVFLGGHPPHAAADACLDLNALVGRVGTRRAEGRVDGRAGRRVIGWEGTLGESDVARGCLGCLEWTAT